MAESDGSKRSWTVVRVVAAGLIVVGLAVSAYALVREPDDRPATTVRDDRGEVDGGLNVSCFAYRDVNRSGEFDIEDRPYASLAVEGNGPNGASTASSNTAGFANFGMRLDDAGAAVNRAGTYVFEALPPEGWALTSGPAAQRVEFVEQEGSPVGIVALGRCVPYGLAPALTISGSGAPDRDGEATGEVTVEVTAGSGAGPVDVDLAGDGSYRAPVDPGEWTVRVSSGGAESVRAVTVTDQPVVVSAFADDREQRDPLPAPVVVGFDDLTTAATIVEVPNGYRGLDWTNWVATHRIVYGGPGYVNVGTSGEFVAYNGSGHPARVSSDDPFDFVGASIGVAWPEAGAYDVVVRAWRGDDLVYTDTLSLSSAGPTYFDAEYRSITGLEIASSAYWQVVVDDMEFRVGR